MHTHLTRVLGRTRLLLLLAVTLCAVAGAQTTPVEVKVPNAAEVMLDRVAPDPGHIAGPQSVNKMPITFSYSGANDGTGSGVKKVTLWFRSSLNSAWTATSVTGTGAPGALSFDGLNTDGRYYFAVCAEDYAGNESARPQGEGEVCVALDRRPPVLKLVGASTVYTGLGGAYSDQGATAQDEIDGDLSSAIQVDNKVDTTKPGTYFVTYRVTDKAGNVATSIYRTVHVEGGCSLTINPPARGQVEVNPSPGATGLYASGTTVTLRYVADPLAGYDVSGWTGASSDVPGSDLARVVMDDNKTVSVQLVRQTGSVSVDVTPNDATWKLVDGDGASRDGSGDATLSSVPTGQVSVQFTAREGMSAPATQQAILLKGATVAFQGVYAGADEATLVLPMTLKGAPGDVVECAVQVSTAKTLTDFGFQLAVDSSVVEVVDAVNGSLLSGWAPVSVQKSAGGATFSGTGAATASGGGTLFVARLRVLANAASGAVVPLVANAVSFNGGALPATAQNGQLTVQGQQFVWGDLNGDGTAGDSDASLLLQYHVGLIERLPNEARAALAVNVSGETPAAVGTLDASLMLRRGANRIATFPSDTNGDGFGPEQTPPTIPATPSETPRTVQFAQSVEVEQGVQFSLPIAMSNAGGVLGYSATVTYDPNTVEFLSAGRGSVTQSWIVPFVNAQPGAILVAAAGVEAAQGGGSLVVLNFRTLTGVTAATAAFELARIELNDGAIPCSASAPTAAPILESISPARGAEAGGTVVTLKGANLGSVTEVRFGQQVAPWFEVQRNQTTLKAVTPQGAGAVDVTVESAQGPATLAGGFTYFLPDVYLTIEPQTSVEAGNVVDVPVTLTITEKGKVASVRFELRFDPALFAVQPDSAITLASPGTAITGSGKSVSATLVGPGRLSVNISGTPSQTLSAGLLCTCHLLALGDTADTTGLFYVTDIVAANTKNIEISSEGGTSR